MYEYGAVQMAWGCIYLLAVLIMMMAACILCIKHLGGYLTNAESVGIGTGITPFLIAIWMIAVSFLPDFLHKQYFVMLMPVIVSLFVILKYWRFMTNGASLWLKNYAGKNKFLFLLFSGSISLFSMIVLVTVSGYMVHTDAGFYTGEALRFVKSLSFHDIANHMDTPGLNGSVHNFIWPAYISYGMLFTGNNLYGLGHDLGVYWGIRCTAIVLLGVLSCTLHSFCGNKETSAVGVVLFFLIPYTHIIRGYSRDLFRVLPLLLFIMLLHAELRREKTPPKEWHMLVFLTAAYIPSGHPINAFTMLAIGLAWAICHMIRKGEIKQIVKYAMVMSGGAISGMYNIVHAYIATGSLSGNSSLYMETIFSGTELEAIYFASMEATTSRGMGTIETWKKIFETDAFHIVTVALMLAVVIVVLSLLKKKYTCKIFICLILLISSAMIFIGHYFGWQGFRYDEWLSRNIRYSHQFYYMAVCVLTCFFDSAIQRLPDKIMKRNATWIAVFLFMPFALKNIRSTWNILLNNNQSEKMVYDHAISEINNVIEEAGEKDVIVTQTNYIYDTGLRAKLLSSYFGVPLFRADNSMEIRSFFEDNNVRFICFERGYHDSFYSKANFYHLMTQQDYIHPYLENDRIIIYEFVG